MTKALTKPIFAITLYMHQLGLFAKLHRIFMKTDVSPANIVFTTVEKNKTKISLELGLETAYSEVELREGRTCILVNLDGYIATLL